MSIFNKGKDMCNNIENDLNITIKRTKLTNSYWLAYMKASRINYLISPDACQI